MSRHFVTLLRNRSDPDRTLQFSHTTKFYKILTPKQIKKNGFFRIKSAYFSGKELKLGHFYDKNVLSDPNTVVLEKSIWRRSKKCPY